MKKKFFDRFINRKPERKLLPMGTCFLIDAANLLGWTGPQHAARTLEAMFSGLVSQGYKALFFMEYRSYVWIRSRQGSHVDVALFDAFVDRDEFTLIEEDVWGEKTEADDRILQVAESLPGSVCLTKDRFDDYDGIHQDIVRSGRVLDFTVVKYEDRMFIAASGLCRAVVINGSDLKTLFGKPTIKQEVDASSSNLAGIEDSSCSAHVLVDDGCSRRSMRCAARTAMKPSKRSLEAVRAIAVSDVDGCTSSGCDREKCHVEAERRYRRLRVQAIRDGDFSLSHFSLKRRRAADIAALGARIVY